MCDLHPGFIISSVITKLPFRHLQWRVSHLKTCWWPEQLQWSLHHCCEWACTGVTWFCTLSACQFHHWTDDPAIHGGQHKMKTQCKHLLQKKEKEKRRKKNAAFPLFTFRWQCSKMYNSSRLHVITDNKKSTIKAIWQTTASFQNCSVKLCPDPGPAQVFEH